MMGIGIGVQFGSKLDPAIAIIGDGNTVGWYDSQDLTTITKDGSNLVSNWADRLGSGRDLKAATTARPTWGANGILFDGVANYMKTDAFTWDQPEFIYMVFKQITWTLYDNILDGNAGESLYLIQQNGTPRLTFSAGTQMTDLTTMTLDQYAILRVLVNGASSKIIRNAESAITGNAGAGNAGGFTLARYGNAALYYGHIEVKEIILRNVADSVGNEALIYAYLKNKYSL
jgi:hypothetical protein